MIAYALARNHRPLGKRPGDLEFKILAEKVVAHLDLCRVSWAQKEPQEYLKTP